MHFAHYTKINKGQKQSYISPTTSQTASATVITEFTSPPIPRVVSEDLSLHGMLGNPVPKDEEEKLLASLVFEDFVAKARVLKVTTASMKSLPKPTPQQPETQMLYSGRSAFTNGLGSKECAGADESQLLMPQRIWLVAHVLDRGTKFQPQNLNGEVLLR